MTLIYIFIALLTGIGIPLQTTINSRLCGYVKYPLSASFVAFAAGAIFLLLVSLVMGYNILVPPATLSQAPWWIWLGGTIGVIGLTTNICLFPRIGSVQTVIIPMFGQIIAGVVIDHYGWFYSPHIPFTLGRILGVLLVITGVFMIIMPRKKATKEQSTIAQSKSRRIWQLVGFVAGMLVAARNSINGQLGVVLESSIQAGLIALITGTVVLLIFTGIARQGLTNIAYAVKAKTPWWVWTGGILGAFFIVARAYLVPVLGTGAVVIIGILGQLSCSLAIDKYRLLNSRKRPVTFRQIIGLVFLLIGAITVRVF